MINEGLQGRPSQSNWKFAVRFKTFVPFRAMSGTFFKMAENHELWNWFLPFCWSGSVWFEAFSSALELDTQHANISRQPRPVVTMFFLRVYAMTQLYFEHVAMQLASISRVYLQSSLNDSFLLRLLMKFISLSILQSKDVFTKCILGF